jgi:hypothetical protein
MVVDESAESAGARELVLVLPGFAAALQCAAAALPRLSALEQIVARGDRDDRGGSDDAPSMVMLARVLPQLAGAERIAAGPLSRLADTGRRDEAWWARVDPVHLVPVRDHLQLHLGDPLSVAEADALAAACRELLTGHGFALETPQPDRWYLCAPRALQFSVGEPAAMAGCDVYAMLPDGPDGPLARRLLTELQMVLHEHPVNRARERAGQAAVNSLWLWGGGVLPPEPPVRSLPALASDDPVLRGLWRYAGAVSAPLPETLAAIAPGVILTRRCEAAAHDADPDACRALLERIETQWLRPILAGLREATIARVRLLLGSRGAYALDRRGLRRWWRRTRMLA